MKKKNHQVSITAVIAAVTVIWLAMPYGAQGAILYTAGQYNKLYNENVALQLELDSLKRQYGNDKANLESTISDLNNKIAGLNRELENLRKEQEAERKNSASRIKEMEEMTDLLKKKGGDREKNLIEENQKLQKRCEDDLAKLRDDLVKERQKSLKELSDLRDEYEKKIAELKKEIAGLNNDLSNLKKLTEKQKDELSRMEDQAKELERQLADEIRKGDIKLKRFHDRLIINIDDKISFDSGKADLKKEVMPALAKISGILNDFPEYKIVVEGHTDNVPISTSRFRDNWQLSTERALSVLNYILREKRLNLSRFSAAGYGEYNPIVPNDTPANRALNRRVDIVVVPRLSGK
ncbi:MAG TPA: OmpA family protein [Spirochaetota bacterium]|nr:OmpA family protein [Spirochaetota bacterium]HPC40787.1 OmpA family protein [Spirochaetota bacterium]HPL15764.1 OmpA family protein [Spirochaetota bacterium]HQF07823.1 OmpA family protein [Spirochaetota bacterium]HQH96876.1 OmpA family protein [Spirochaetota bacterium]